MSIGKTYKEAFQKAIRSLENGRYGLGFAKDFNKLSLEELMARLAHASSERQFLMYEALRKGATVERLSQRTFIKPWFIQQMKELVELEETILKYKGGMLPDELLVKAKKDGFADKYLAKLLAVPECEIRNRRKALGVVEGWHAVPVSGVKDAAYYYSSYNAPDTTSVSSGKKVMVLGGGPNRIGQGIEFDYCCVHAAFALRDLGYESIMVNCNPETVSTDYDTSNKLYFEPLTVEDVLSIYEKEKPLGVIVQFGGQTPLNIAAELAAAGVTILGTSPDMIDLAEDRDRFRQAMRPLGIPQPESGNGQQPGRGFGRCQANWLPAHGAAVVCAGGKGDGGNPRRRYAAGVCRGRRRRISRTPDPHRSIPGERHRTGSRLPGRRPRCLRAGGDGTY